MLYKALFFILFPISMYASFDPDTWFALYDDPYITSVEIMGHRYIVQIVSHDCACKCFDLPDYYDIEEYSDAD